MAESSLFMVGKLRKPDDQKSTEEQIPALDLKSKRQESEPERPWVGTAALRELGKRNAKRHKEVQDKAQVPEVEKIPLVPQVLKDMSEFPVSPMRDFHKVSNSVNRIALEGGMFTRPSCKHVYDALYLLTRGAIQPSRTVQIGRKLLQKKAGIGSDKTLDAAVASLQQVGLIGVHIAFGSQKGNVYEVFLPEEIQADANLVKKIEKQTSSTFSTEGTRGTSSTVSTPGYKVPNVPLVDNTDGTNGQTIENTEGYSSDKTKKDFKSKNDDDSAAEYKAFSIMTERLNSAVKKLTGESSSKYEADKWADLADLLILELEVAAKKTNSISSVPAFLTEVLRRQFFASRKEQLLTTGKSPKAKTDTVGKSELGGYEIKPLDEQGREVALNQLQEFVNDDFLEDFKKWYTLEDWNWLVKNLEEGKKEGN